MGVNTVIANIHRVAFEYLVTLRDDVNVDVNDDVKSIQMDMHNMP